MFGPQWKSGNHVGKLTATDDAVFDPKAEIMPE